MTLYKEELMFASSQSTFSQVEISMLLQNYYRVKPLR